jgi:CubicO group peptidase (beta-lactamase class C family)
LYLDRGEWHGRRVVSAWWVDSSTVRHTGYSPAHGYGFAWHVFELRLGGRSFNEYEAEGNGGQVIAVIPALDMAVMYTTGNYNYDDTEPERWILAGLVAAIRK